MINLFDTLFRRRPRRFRNSWGDKSWHIYVSASVILLILFYSFASAGSSRDDILPLESVRKFQEAALKAFKSVMPPNAQAGEAQDNDDLLSSKPLAWSGNAGTIADSSVPAPVLSVINAEPQTFLLAKEDLPSEGQYYLPNENWISPHLNKEVIYEWGVEAGSEYLDKTGRIDGWWVFYKRGNPSISMPIEIFHNIVRYETPEGAQLAVKEFNYITKDLTGDAWEFVDEDADIGDAAVVMVLKNMQPNGKFKVWYRTEVAYRNYVSVIQGYGWEDEVSPEFIEIVSRKVLDDIISSALTYP